MVFRGTGPAWGDTNLRELAGSVRTGLFLAHIRASTGTAVQQTNCHPFRYGPWLWLHNGLVRGFATVKRDLVLAVDPELFPAIAGSTDSELMFYLALTFGLADDPVGAVERMVAYVEMVGRRHGVRNPMQMTVATTDGKRLWAFRYSSENDSRSLSYSTDMSALRTLYPENENFAQVSEETRIVVEPERLGEPIQENSIEFSWGGHRIAQEQTFYAVAIGSVAVSLEGLDQWERATTDKYGWLTADDLETGERPANPDIPDLIRAAVASVRREQARE